VRDGKSRSGDDIARLTAALDQPFDTASLHTLREAVHAAARAAGMTGTRAADVQLAVHELAANVIVHGTGSGHVEVLIADGTFRCLVTDTGNCAAPPPAPWPVLPAHGLWLVHKIADHVEITFGPGGAAVTLVFALS
jgi:anti-sigma regulatory factor (Ser/Thr protein kinase)